MSTLTKKQTSTATVATQLSEAEKNAQRLLAPQNVNFGVSGYTGNVKQIEAVYRDSGVIPEGCYMFVGRPDATNARVLTAQGYRRLVDPETSQPVSTEHGDPCYWRERELQNRHLANAANSSLARMKSFDAAYSQSDDAAGIKAAASSGDVGLSDQHFSVHEKVSAEQAQEIVGNG